ncbi:MAG: 30S ribosomal protein S21 [Candidatus Shikimatogenerans bostrichidophilus]|nr:MAG: 30S ribosomal protein S21 [Candidatus Shikimatogenerans bostrichidophilus]
MKLITIIKEGDNIDKYLKIYKKKINKLNVIKILKEKLQYIKPSKKRRLKLLKKKYIIKKNIYEK